MKRLLLPAAMMFLASAGPLLAADSAPNAAPPGKPWVAMVLGFIFLTGAVLINIMSSKRGHRD